MTAKNTLALNEDEPSCTANVPPGPIHGPELPTGPECTSAIPCTGQDRAEVAAGPITRTAPGGSRRTGSVWSRPAKGNRRVL
jgi:hypothetical protein